LPARFFDATFSRSSSRRNRMRCAVPLAALVFAVTSLAAQSAQAAAVRGGGDCPCAR